jgi:hypothetical protein
MNGVLQVVLALIGIVLGLLLILSFSGGSTPTSNVDYNDESEDRD